MARKRYNNVTLELSCPSPDFGLTTDATRSSHRSSMQRRRRDRLAAELYVEIVISLGRRYR
jgi:hypothetical protein